MSAPTSTPWVDDSALLAKDLVHLARLALAAEAPQVTPLLRRFARRYRETAPELAAALIALLRETPVRSATQASTAVPRPVDSESRLSLVREEYPVDLGIDPVFPADVAKALLQLTEEHLHADRLVEHGLAPSRTALFVGPPGVGKTLAARSLAQDLDVPLLVLDLASVMSSLLGKTGENIRRVLHYAKQMPCVLLLDELDAIAKKRDDSSEIGELKRLVTVLLQELDSWPEGSILLAATNHEALLDPAVWRRFEVLVRFPLPDEKSLRAACESFLMGAEVPTELLEAAALAFAGHSFSDLERNVQAARRRAAIQQTSLNDSLLSLIQERLADRMAGERFQVAQVLAERSGFSQRRVSEVTGVSRDTLRRHLKLKKAEEGL